MAVTNLYFCKDLLSIYSPLCFIVGIRSDGIFLLHCLAYIHITKGFKALHFALIPSLG